MSVESARAFCMRLMSDEEFQVTLAKATAVSEISELLKKEYDFSKHDLLKTVNEMVGKPISAEELKQTVCDFYANDLASENPNAAKLVAEWFDGLQ